MALITNLTADGCEDNGSILRTAISTAHLPKYTYIDT